MNMSSFLDELVKVGAGRILVKRSSDSVNTTDIPSGMMGDGYVPPAMDVMPQYAETRLPNTAQRPSQVPMGTLGGVTEAKNPIDRYKYNRVYQERT